MPLPTLLALLLTRPADACGPFLPDCLLTHDMDVVAEAPEGDFASLIAQIPSDTQGLKYDAASEEDADREDALADLAAVPAAQQAGLLQLYLDARKAMRPPVREYWEPAPANPPPPPAVPEAPKELPAELSLYLVASAHWHRSEGIEACDGFRQILALPADQRRRKTTWARYMAAGCVAPEDRAAAWQAVREDVRAGFADSDSLAVASLGEEARLRLNEEDVGDAMKLYLAQAAAGDPGGLTSLEFASREVLGSDSLLASAVRDPVAARVLAAYVVSRAYWSSDEEAGRWLAAVQAAGATDLAGADLLALSAYQQGDYAAASSWAERAADGPTVRWVKAKLALRDGRLDDADRLLASVSWPPDTAWHDEYGQETHPSDEVASERSVVLLRDGRYVDALAVLAPSEDWMGTAYVAERVLTVDELKAYVDAHVPEPAWPGHDPVVDSWAPVLPEEGGAALNLRWLLARRLARAGRLDEAAAYYPLDLRGPFVTYRRLLEVAKDPAFTDAQRADAEWRAARIARHLGMELLGTEVEPDIAAFSGEFEWGGVVSDRLALTGEAAPTADERARVEASAPTPNERFHYRYTAADLAWDAASKMPDDDVRTAQVLCVSGSWLQSRDPAAADRFYKALVHRNPNVPLAQTADALRWFPPVLDGDVCDDLVPDAPAGCPLSSWTVLIAPPLALWRRNRLRYAPGDRTPGDPIGRR